MARTAAIVLAAALCLAAFSSAAAQGAKPQTDGNNGTFSNFAASQFKFKYAVPTFSNQLSLNLAPAVGAAGFTQRLFALKPCQLFAPHFHPGGAEFFLGVRGRMNIIVNINQKLVRNSIERDDAVIVPQNTFHYFFNNGCSEAAVITAINSAAPGFQGYYSVPSAVLKTIANYETIETLIDRNVANSTLDESRAFFALTNGCQAKCQKRVMG